MRGLAFTLLDDAIRPRNANERNKRQRCPRLARDNQTRDLVDTRGHHNRSSVGRIPRRLRSSRLLHQLLEEESASHLEQLVSDRV